MRFGADGSFGKIKLHVYIYITKLFFLIYTEYTRSIFPKDGTCSFTRLLYRAPTAETCQRTLRMGMLQYYITITL